MHQEISEVIDRYIQLIQKPTTSLLNQIFTSDSEPSLISITKVFNGKQAIYNDFIMNSLYDKYTSIKLFNDGLRIKEVNQNLVIVVFRYHTECILKDTSEKYGIEGLETQVLIKENNTWKINHIHYSK